jgi:flagellar hook assembly protein FlgD
VVGREVRTLVNGLQEPGYREVLWNGRNNLGQPVSAGIYFAEMEAGGYRNIRKLILLK